MLRVGITGGIGSGKTTVCGVFETLGVPVYQADDAVKRLYTENEDLQNALLDVYGPDVLINGTVNKAFLTSVVFGSAAASEKLSALVHPFVFDDYESWCRAREDCPYTIKEAAILFESGGYKRIHRAIGVVAPEELRIHRTMERDKCSRADVLKRMQKQLAQKELASKCHYIIENDGNHSLLEQVLNTHRQLLAEANKSIPFMA